jgi:23S rRNA (cytidine1920-2'-O)/16S rRNA (cytidine1409-2'-O)-methyltransferase
LKNAVRLDTLLVDRGLAASRERARALILAGNVRVNGQPASKAGTPVPADAEVIVATPDHPYVGRGGLKLAHAVDTFAIPVIGRTALDIGASTGGFTDVLLQRGAARVVALDVGHGQLDWKIRNDPRVDVIERKNARTLTLADLPPGRAPFQIVTIDVSFISLRLILPVVPALVDAGADVIALVKPQFEAGRAEVGKGGIVRDPAVHARVLEEVAVAADALGLRRAGTTESPIAGMEGNREYLLHLQNQ